MPEFPAMMYRAGTAFQWEEVRVDTLIVAREAEYETALAEGWSIGKPSADAIVHVEPVKRRGRPPKA